MSPPVPAHLYLGEQIGRNVFRADCVLLGRTVAVKYFRPEQADIVASLHRFVREVHLMGRLDHRNIIRLHDVGHIDDWHYVVMEFVVGVTLQDRLSDDLEHGRAVGFDLQLRDVLQYTHSLGIKPTHLSPDNVLVDADDTIKVLTSAWKDFEILEQRSPIWTIPRW